MKTAFLMALMTALLMLLGDFFGGLRGMTVMLFVGVAMNFFAYWNSDKMGEINGIKVYPSPKYHPCMDYNCRCVALPVIDLEQWNMTTAVPMGMVDVKKSKELS